MTWAEVYRKFEARCKTKRIKASSMYQYARTMGWFCEWADGHGIAPVEIEPLDVVEYLGNLTREDGKTYKANSLRAHARDVRTLMNFAAEYKIIPEKVKVEMPKAEDTDIKALTDQEIDRVVVYFEDRAEEDPRSLAIIYFLLDSGVRAAELLGLNWSDLTWNEENQIGKARISKQLARNGELVSVKNNKPRDVYFTARTWKSLLAIKASFPGEAPPGDIYGPRELYRSRLWHPKLPVFLSVSAWKSGYARLTTSGLRWLLEQATEATGIKLHAHLFRHTAGRLMTIREMPPMAVKAILGHSSLAMVEHYSRLWGRDVEDLYAAKMNGSD